MCDMHDVRWVSVTWKHKIIYKFSVCFYFNTLQVTNEKLQVRKHNVQPNILHSDLYLYKTAENFKSGVVF